MNACLNWMAADFLIRDGFTITTDADGMRTAARGALSFQIERGCGHEDCPPLVSASQSERVAA